jgi:HEAT repeat protein
MSSIPAEETTHLQAVDLLARAGPAALPALTQAVGAKEDRVRAGAAQALAHMDRLPEPITRRLRQLADEDVSTPVRRWAAVALARQGRPLSAEDAEELFAALQQPGGFTAGGRRGSTWFFDWRGAVIPTLARQHPLILDRLLKAVSSETVPLRDGAVETLAALALEGEAARAAMRPAVALLKERIDLEHPARIIDPAEACWAGAWAAVALARLGAEQEPALSALLSAAQCLESWREKIGQRRGFGVGERGDSILRLEKAVPDALRRIDDRVVIYLLGPLHKPLKNQARFLSVRVLMGCGRGPTVLPLLLRTLADDQSSLQDVTAQELVNLAEKPRAPGAAPAPEAVIQALREALEAQSPLVRVLAARALVAHGRDLDWARTVLLDGLDGEEEVVQAALPGLLDVDIPPEVAPRLLTRAVRKGNEDLLRVFYRAVPDALPPLEALLTQADPAARNLAAGVLKRFGPTAVPALTRALTHPDPRMRQSAAEAVGGIDPVPEGTRRALRRLLRDPDPAVVLASAATLAQSSETTAEALPVLVQVLRQGDAATRERALTTLAHAGEDAQAAVPDVVKALGDSVHEVRMAACQGLPRMGPAGRRCLPDLLAALLKDPDADLRRQALVAVRRTGRNYPDDHETIARLVLPYLDDPEEQIRRDAVWALYGLNRPRIAPLVLPRMVEELRDPNNAVSGIAEDLVRHAGAAAVPHLARLLADETSIEVRCNVLEMLSDLSVETKLVLPVLLRTLSDRDPRLREAAYSALSCMEKGESAVPALVDRLLCRGDQDRVWAAKALGRMGKRARVAVPALLPLLRDSPGPLRLAVLKALLAMEPDAADAFPVYAPLVHDRSPYIRNLAVQGLAGLGPAALPALLEALQDASSESVRLQAANGLKNLKGPADKVLPALSRALNDSSHQVRTAAALGLAELGPSAAPAVPLLTTALSDADPEARAAAAQALGRVGAREAAAALKRLLRDRHEPVRRAAAEALGKLGA